MVYLIIYTYVIKIITIFKFFSDQQKFVFGVFRDADYEFSIEILKLKMAK